MFSIKNLRFTSICYCFIAVMLIWVSANLNWGDGRWNNIVLNDGNGYYAYLPAIFIYHDLTFEFINEVASDSLNSNINNKFVFMRPDGVVNKYSIGTSLALIPFFALGHFSNLIYGYPLDGYSVFYRIFIQVGTIFYALLGLFLLIKILRWYKFEDRIIAISLISIVFGTNIFHYVVSEPSMSHIFSFAYVNLFVFCFIKFFETTNFKYVIYGILALALIVLIRPINILVIFSLPFIAGSLNNLSDAKKYFIHNWKNLILTGLIFVCVVMIQLIIYYIQTGKFLVYSYDDEYFNFLDPHLLDFMFSYRRQFFLYQ